MTMKKFIFVCSLAAVAYTILGSPLTIAATDTRSHTVLSVVTDAQRYGGCMIKISPGPEAKFAGCKPAFVSLGCDGSLGIAKSTANQLLAQAQLALVTGKKVILRTNDDGGPTTSRGYCLADRVDVSR